jgi:DNA-binding transcriptional LysR family regulator
MGPMPKNGSNETIERQRADWSDLRLLYAVASLGGFGAAARALGVGQPTVSKRIEDLELRLNTKLLNRGPQGVTLTEAGEVVFDKVQTMERAALDIESLVSNADKREEGTVGVAAPDGIGAFILAPAIANLFRTYPKISVSLDCGLWPADRLPASIDIALQFDQAVSAEFLATPLAYVHYALFGSAAYLDTYKRPTTLQEASTHRYVHHSAQNKQAESLPASTPALQQLAHKQLMTNSSNAMVQAIKNGAGIGPLPTAVLSLEPELEMLELPLIASVTLWMCVRRDVLRAARIKRVTDWLKETFDGRTHPWFRAEFVHPKDFGLPKEATPLRLVPAQTEDA